jgi:hypothetical protein
MAAIMIMIVVLLGQIFDLVDQSSRTMSATIFIAHVYRLLIERSVVEHSFHLAGQSIALACDIGDLFQIFCVS